MVLSFEREITRPHSSTDTRGKEQVIPGFGELRSKHRDCRALIRHLNPDCDTCTRYRTRLRRTDYGSGRGVIDYSGVNLCSRRPLEVAPLGDLDERSPNRGCTGQVALTTAEKIIQTPHHIHPFRYRISTDSKPKVAVLLPRAF